MSGILRLQMAGNTMDREMNAREKMIAGELGNKGRES